MNVEDAKKKALQILAEEQIRPTVDYQFVSANPLLHVAAILDGLKSTAPLRAEAAVNIWDQRMFRPRAVLTNPRNHEFRSENYKLLLAIYEQVHGNDRTDFVAALLNLVPSQRCWRRTASARFPNYLNSVSCLPLVVEFCVRVGHKEALFAALQVPQFPTPGLAILLMQLEEMIAVNFDLFRDQELERIPSSLAHLRKVAFAQTWESSRPRGGLELRKNPDYKPGYKAVGSEIVEIIDALGEECAQARMHHLKIELEPRTNQEVESDRGRVESFLSKLGFGPDMAGALNAAENEYRKATTDFELKNCFVHLRSFLEHLHRTTAKSIAARAGETVKDRWGSATEYLMGKGLFRTEHKDFATSLFTLISDTSLHPLGADREYARLLRNVVIEYGVMFLSVLDKNGISIR